MSPENTVKTPPVAPAETDEFRILDIGEEADLQEKDPTKRKRLGLMGLYQKLNEKIQSFSAIKTKDKVAFFQLIAIMIGAGVPLIRSLYVLSQQLDNARLKVSVRQMAEKVEGGKRFSDAMEDYAGIFTDSQIGMVKAGEASGRLTEVLLQIAQQTEKSAAVTRKIKGAMIYPIVVFTIMIGAIFVILGMVVPQLMELFTQANADLPVATKVLIAMSNIVVNYYTYIFGGIVVFIGLVYLWKQTESGHYQLHQLLLRLPVFGLLLRYLCLARFTRTLGSLIMSGIPIVKSLQIDADVIGNEVYRRRILLAAEDVSRGIPLAENLMDSTFLFPEMVVSMVSVGEQTAEVAKVMDKIADYYDAEVDQMAANMSKLLEPIIMVTMGIVVGGLIVAVMQPIFSLLDVVGTL